jgi:ribonuclease D
MPPPLTQPAEVAALAAELAAAGAFALDLEFVSESRYVPELALVQVAWGKVEQPEVAAVDPLAVDPRPVVELVSDPRVKKLLHAGQGDLALLAYLFGVRGEAVVDTQIAASFVGLGDQVGYAPLAHRLLGIELDKTSQFTRWTRRPLSAEQLAYALDDVRYLPRLWAELERRLKARGRVVWVEEESRRLAETAARRIPPDEVFRRIRGWNTLQPRQLGALRALTAWREREALASNRPPAWILQEGPLLALARRPPKSQAALAEVRGVSEAVVRRHGKEVLAALRRGLEEPLEATREPALPAVAQGWAALLAALIAARCREADVAQRFVAGRGDAEALAGWWLAGDRGREPDLPLLQGWRRNLAGQAVLDWLAGRTAIAADGGAAAGIQLVPGKPRRRS